MWIGLLQVQGNYNYETKTTTRYCRSLLLSLIVGVFWAMGFFEMRDLDKLEETGVCVECDLIAVNLSGANLTNSVLTGATLRLANLSSANLRGASLANAYLASAELTHARLDNVDLTGTIFCGTKMPDESFNDSGC